MESPIDAIAWCETDRFCLEVKGERFIWELATVGRQLKMNKLFLGLKPEKMIGTTSDVLEIITVINLGVRSKPAANKQVFSEGGGWGRSPTKQLSLIP